ncbi:MAG TPA: hypothetical protein VEV17_15170 [Bryobacteraceae bacterium]|nr:hypothetical protein [Bryobacteraceae bacterium]
MVARMVLPLTFLFAGLRAEIIDRVAVTLDNQVITESEILREIRLTAFLNGDPLDFSPEVKRKAAARLIEQKLIRKEIELGRYTEPNPAETESSLRDIQIKRFPSAREYREALEKYGVTEKDLKAHLAWQITLLRFIDARFRPGIQVSDDEVRRYFEKHLPELEKQAGPANQVHFEDVRGRIEEALINQRVDKELNDWLDETRKRAHIQLRQEAFQ